jgi:hypothetical protein
MYCRKADSLLQGTWTSAKQKGSKEGSKQKIGR